MRPRPSAYADFRFPALTTTGTQARTAIRMAHSPRYLPGIIEAILRAPDARGYRATPGSDKYASAGYMPDDLHLYLAYQRDTP